MAIKTKVSYAHCSITVIGVDMTCPLCGVVVKSGNHHLCEKEEPRELPAKKKRKKLPAYRDGETRGA